MAFIHTAAFAQGQTWLRFQSGFYMDGVVVDTTSNNEFTGLKYSVNSSNYTFINLSITKFNGQGNLIESDIIINTTNGYSLTKISDGGYLFLNPSSTHDTLIKISANGAIQWKKLYPIAAGNNAKIVEDAQHNYLLVSQGGIITKINTSGNSIWTKTYSFFSAINITKSSSGYLVGGYNGNRDKIVLVKLDTNGDTLFTRKYAMNGSVVSYLNTPDGGFLGSTNYGYIYKIDSSANLLWSKKMDISPLCVYKDYFFGRGNDYFKIVKVNSNTGDTSWTFNSPYSIMGGLSACTDGGVIAVCTTSVYMETALLRLNAEGELFASKVKGKISRDNNNNCVLETGENPLKGILVQAVPGPLYTFTDYKGNYEFLLDTGITYTIFPPINASELWENNCIPSYSIFFAAYAKDSIGKDFTLNPILCPDVKVNFIGDRVTHCMKMDHKLICKNQGNSIAKNVELSLEIPSVYIVKGASIPYIQIGNKLVFQVGDIDPDSTIEVIINDSISCYANINERYYLKSIARSPITCSVLNSNTDTSISIIWVSGSYDPNGKNVFPNQLNYSEYSNGKKELHYLIHFQNTGSSPALNIKIVDTLPAQLDLATIRNITSSHSVKWQFVNNDKTIIKWSFDSINLPYKNQNEVSSQGYLSFTVDIANGLPAQTIITNKAAIYFDYNLPVMTDEAIVEISFSGATETYSAKYVNISLSSPINNSTLNYPTDIAIAANVVDPDQVIVKVEFYDGNSLIGFDLVAPYNYDWNGILEGVHAITAKATDHHGETYTSTVASFAAHFNQAPTVSILSPLNNTVFSNTPANIEIVAAAADADGSIKSVDFYEGTTLLGSSSSVPYSYSLTGVPIGSYILKAIANDSNGKSSLLSEVNIIVEENTTGIISSQNNSPVKVAPNPFTNTASVSVKIDDTILLMAIYDINGKQISNLKASSTELTFGEELQPGVYTVLVVTETQSITKKIIKMP